MLLPFFQNLRTALGPLLELLCTTGNTNETGTPCFSLVGLRSNSGFSAGLLLTHQSEASRLEELEQLGPHLGMLGTLMTLMVL